MAGSVRFGDFTWVWFSKEKERLFEEIEFDSSFVEFVDEFDPFVIDKRLPFGRFELFDEQEDSECERL